MAGAYAVQLLALARHISAGGDRGPDDSGSCAGSSAVALAYLASMIAAACQIGWIIVHVAVLQRFFFLQPVLRGAGLLIGALALRSHRGHRLFPDPT
jgi:hypothetical protein